MHDLEAIRQVLAKYVRAADRRDGTAMGALFLEEGCVEIASVSSGTREVIGVLAGRAAIAVAVATLMQPHPPRGWSHHTTHDHIIEVEDDQATIDAQFIVYNTLGAEKPAAGWPAGAAGLQGSVTPIEAGYYRSSLVRIDGRWWIERHQIDHDLPMALPEAS